MTRLLPHAVVLTVLVAAALSWDLFGPALPSLDALLAPGGATPWELALTFGGLGLRAVGVLLLPGLTLATLVDAAGIALAVATERGGQPAG